MSDIWKIVLTSCLTIAGGVIVFVLGKLAEKFIIEPIHELWGLRGEIDHSLSFFGYIYSNVVLRKDEFVVEAERAFREQACRLRARAAAIPCYWLFHSLGWIPSKADVYEASEEMRGLSNSLRPPYGEASAPHYNKENKNSAKKIRTLLEIGSPSMLGRFIAKCRIVLTKVSGLIPARCRRWFGPR